MKKLALLILLLFCCFFISCAKKTLNSEKQFPKTQDSLSNKKDKEQNPFKEFSFKELVSNDRFLEDRDLRIEISKDTIWGKKVSGAILKRLIYFDYPQKWNTYIDEIPYYPSDKDSLADFYSSNLKTWQNLAYRLYEGDYEDYKYITYNPLKPLKNFEDGELLKIFDGESTKEGITFKYSTYKWDRPYFAKLLHEDKDVLLNLYKNGDKYEPHWDHNPFDRFFVVNYLLIEIIHKKTQSKKYYFISIDTNNYLSLYERDFYIDTENRKIVLIDFLLEEVENYFIGRQEYSY